MRAKFLVILIWFGLTGSFAFAQDEKTEIGVFAGGYFNSGFQSFKVLNPTTGAQVGTFKPTSEANSGIFGVRSSYNFRPQMAVEATFGFSPAGRSQNSFASIPAGIVLVTFQGNTCSNPRSSIAGWECVSVHRNSFDLFQSARNMETVLHGRSRGHHENSQNRLRSKQRGSV